MPVEDPDHKSDKLNHLGCICPLGSLRTQSGERLAGCHLRSRSKTHRRLLCLLDIPRSQRYPFQSCWACSQTHTPSTSLSGLLQSYVGILRMQYCSRPVTIYCRTGSRTLQYQHIRPGRAHIPSDQALHPASHRHTRSKGHAYRSIPPDTSHKMYAPEDFRCNSLP